MSDLDLPPRNMTNGPNSWFLVGIGLSNVIFVVLGFAANYVADITRNADTVALLTKETSAIHMELENIHRHEQTTDHDTMVDRQNTAVRLATIERDVKYVQSAVDDLRHASGIAPSRTPPP